MSLLLVFLFIQVLVLVLAIVFLHGRFSRTKSPAKANLLLAGLAGLISNAFGCKPAPTATPSATPAFQMAQALCWPDRILVASSAHSITGYNLSSPPYIQLGVELGDAELGAALRLALASNRYGCPDPDFRDKSFNQARFQAAGVKTEKAFMANARMVQLHFYERSLHLTATRNGGSSGPKRGFSGIQEQQLAEGFSDSELGQAVRLLWALCE